MEINPSYTVDSCPDGSSPSTDTDDLTLRRDTLRKDGVFKSKGPIFTGGNWGPVEELEIYNSSWDPGDYVLFYRIALGSPTEMEGMSFL